MKKIAIDCRILGWKHSGMTRYLDNILKAIKLFDKRNSYFLLTPGNVILGKNYLDTTFEQVSLSSNEFIYKFIDTPRFLKKEKIDIYWSPTPELPVWRVRNCKYISTIHDIAYEYNRDWFSFKVRLMSILGYYAHSARMANHIFAISNFTKNEVLKKYRIAPEKITVTYEGVDDRFVPLEKNTVREHLRERFDIKSKYIFYIDTVRSRNLISAFSDLVKSEWKDFDIVLVCLGKFGDETQKPLLLAKEYGISEKIIHIEDFISDFDLNNLYSGCEFFVSPSFYEGFGLTPLEALQSGAAILVSDVTSLPEVFQDAALYCDPYDSNDIKSKMNELYRDQSKKNEILKNSRKLFEIYDWNIVAGKIRAIFDR